MNKWLQRTVGTASIACGIALAASGIAQANQPIEIGDPLGSVSSLSSVADPGSVTGLAGGVPTDGLPAGGLPTDNPVGMVPDATQLTGQVGGVTKDLPGKKVVGSVSKLGKTGTQAADTAAPKTEGLPVGDGVPVVGGVTHGGLPAVGGNPITGGSAGQDLVNGVPVVGNMVGSAMNPNTVPAAAAKPAKAEKFGMGSDLVGSTMLGKGAVGGLHGDVTRPAEDLPLVGQLPVVDGLTQGGLPGATPLGADAPAPKK